jgi:UAA transporter family
MHVKYPQHPNSSGLQVLAKSCKMIPVMVMGTLVGGKRYSMIEYVCAGLIAGGISLFAAQVTVYGLLLANSMQRFNEKRIVNKN